VGGEFAGPSPEAPPQKSGLLFRVFIRGLFIGLFLLILLVIVFEWFVTVVSAPATVAKAQADVQHLASAVDQYQAHMGAPPATLAELTSPATNARGQTAGPYSSLIPSPSLGFSAYRYERHADGHWTITTSGRDSCDRPHRIEATSGSSVTPYRFINCPGQFWWRFLFAAQHGPYEPVSPHAVGLTAAPKSAAADPELAQIQWRTAIPAHFSAVFAVDISPDGETIASGSHDGTVKLWNARTGAPIAALAGHAGTVGAVAFSPKGRTLYTADAAAVHAWDVSTHEQQRQLVGHTAQVSSVAVSRDGTHLASGGFDGTVRLRDAATGTARLVLTHGAGVRIFSAAFSPDGTRVASAGSDGRIDVWNAKDGGLEQTLQGHRAAADRVAFAPDGQTLVSVGDDRTLRAWSLVSRHELYTRSVPRGEIWTMAISSDGQTIATGGQDGVIRLWSLMTGTVARAFSDLAHSGGTLSLAFSRDSRLLVTGHGDNYVKTWPLDGGEHVAPTGVAATAGDEDAMERVGWQPMHVAAWDGNLPALKKLIAEHANVDERNAYGRTPLYLAAKRGHLEAVKLLAAGGANVDAPARDDMTPLWPAVQNGNVEIVRWLLDHGADAKHLTAQGQSPLYKAAEQGRTDIAKLILARQVPLNDRDVAGYTPLGIAVKGGHASVVELLAGQRGIDLNARNGRKSQVTPLQLAAVDGHADIVSILIAKGANVNDRGGAEWSALQVAQQQGYTSIVESLKAVGAN